MKVIVEVNLNDIWPEYEESSYGPEPTNTLGKQVEQAIAHEVQQKVWNLVKDQVTKKITDDVYNMVQSQVSSKIDAYTEAFLAQGTFTKGSSEPKSVKDYVESFITEQKVWTSFASNLSKVAENFAKDVQKKYDVLFATKIVMSLKDTGMLDKDRLQALFQDKVGEVK